MIQRNEILRDLSDVVREQKNLRREKLVEVYRTVVAVSSVMVSVLASLPPSADEFLPVALLYRVGILLSLLSALLGFLALWGEALFHQRALNLISKKLEDTSAEDIHRSLSTEMIYPHWFFVGCSRATPWLFCLALVVLTCYAIART